MKIASSVRRVWNEQKERNSALEARVVPTITKWLDDRWHFERRLKGEESFALKISTGRVADAKNLEDFFACTVVVRNLNEIDLVETLAKECFRVVERRPTDRHKTDKNPDSFLFDDLRLYLELTDDETDRYPILRGCRFELQIKTYLQHAWGIATHDLTYKSSSVSWAKLRIAYQTKAMLENAEVSIAEAERLASSPALERSTDKVEDLGKIIGVISSYWSEEERPVDMKRMADCVNALLRECRISLDQLNSCLELMKNEDRLSTNVSPFDNIVAAISYNFTDELRSALTRKNGKLHLVLPRELDVEPTITRLQKRVKIL